MVYGRQRSQGCILCRKRKIKCDEEKPFCNNCKAYGKECPGYTQPSQPFIFRNENQKVEKLVQKDQKKRPRAGPHRFDINAGAVIRTVAARQDSPISLSVPRYLYDTSWEQRSHCYFLDQFTLPPELDGSPGPLDSIPVLYTLCQRTDTDNAALSCLRSALDAAAYTALANKTNVPPLAVQAKRKYGVALGELNRALSNVEDAVRDETLGAIVLLTLFEDVNSERNSLFSIHISGIQYLLKLRGLNQLFNPATRSLFHFAFTQMTIQLLGLNDPLMIDVDWLMGVFTIQYPIYNMMASVLKISKFRATVEQVLAPGSPFSHTVNQETLTSFLEMGECLDLEFDQWHRGTPDEWLPKTLQTLDGEMIITYTDNTSAAVWNYYRGAKIVLQRTLIQIHRQLNPFYNTNDTASILGLESPEDIIRRTVEDICRTIPYALGDVDRFGLPTTVPEGGGIKAIQQFALLWPIWTVTQFGFCTPEQDQKARAALGRIGMMSGIKLGLALADENTVLDRASLASPSLSSSSSPSL